MNSPRIGFMFDTNSQTLTALNMMKVLMSNPANSGKKIICESYGISNVTNVAAMGSFFVDPSGGFTPSTIVKPMPFLIDDAWQTPNNVGIFKYDVALITAGGWSGSGIISVPVKPMDRNFVEGAPLTIMPGHSLGFQFGAVAMAGVTFVMYTREENI